MRMILVFLRIVWARFRGRALTLELGTRRWNLFPDGSAAPVIAGASDPPIDPTDPPEDDQVSEDVRRLEEEDEQDEDVEPEGKEPEPEDTFDRDRAMRTIRQQREAEKKERERRQQVEAERDELRRAQETEQERMVRETGEAKEAAERERKRADKAAIDLALRDAAAEEGIPGKKLKRVLKMVDRDEITVDEDGTVSGVEDAVADLLDEFPEFREDTPAPSADDDDAPARRKPGANPDRRQSRDGGEITAKQAARIAREDPDRFVQLMDEGKIGSDQMGGKELNRLRSEGKLSSRSADAEHGVTPAPVHVRG